MRKFLTIFIIIFTFTSQISARGNQQIVNGVPSEIQPFMVSIRSLKMDADRFGSGHLCGGTILTFNLILTTASCLIDQNDHFLEIADILIIAGTNRRYEEINAITLFPRMISIHPNHNANNIALIETWSMPRDSRNIQPINMTTEAPIPGDLCAIYGFGQALSLNGPSQLLTGSIQIVDRSACHEHRTNNLCSSGNTFPCNGDSGGGVICDRQIAGIIDNFDFDHCRLADEIMHTSYIDIAPYREWILAHMRRIELEGEAEDKNGTAKGWKIGVLFIFVNIFLIFMIEKFENLLALK